MVGKKKSHPAKLPGVPGGRNRAAPKAKHAKKRKVQKPADAAKDIELYPDAWERFEEGLKQASKPKRKVESRSGKSAESADKDSCGNE